MRGKIYIEIRNMEVGATVELNGESIRVTNEKTRKRLCNDFSFRLRHADTRGDFRIAEADAANALRKAEDQENRPCKKIRSFDKLITLFLL